MSSQRSEIVVVGGGFGGALLSWILAAEGKSVTLIDAPRPIGHPIVGESSTPLADLILLQLANQYSLPSLAALARYGSWASTFGTDGESGGPICGKKRGFSYFAHTPNQYFRDPTPHSRSLYVTASADDASSDTHWHRESVDAFLRASAVRAGARLIAGTLEDLQPADRWRLSIQASGEPIQLRADEIVDATALAVVARLMRRADVVQAPRCKTNQLQTATHSVFTHLRGVGEFANSRSFCVESTDGDPFHGDDAAQHHLLHDGWMWVLRFDNGIASVGRVFQGKKSAARPLPCDNIAKQFGVSQYPSLRDMLSGSTPAYPTTPLVRTKRLQKWLGPSAGAGFFLLPNAASTIDPMHSTGLAHTAAGVARVAHLLLQVDSDDVAARQRYQETIDREVRWLDQMIRLTYDHLHDFDAFVSATMPYFCAAICSEESLRSNWSAMQDNQRSLWTADDEGLAAALVDIRELLADGEAEDHRRVGELLQPWNTAGLCNMDANLRYRYTAASKT